MLASVIYDGGVVETPTPLDLEANGVGLSVLKDGEKSMFVGSEEEVVRR